MTASQRDEAEPFVPALRPQFGLKTLALSLVVVSLTFALSRWLPAAVVAAIVFACGLVALHVFSTALGRKLRASRPDERAKRRRGEVRAADPSTGEVSAGEASAGEFDARELAGAGELRERRSVASFASRTAVLVAGAFLGVACGWSSVSDARIVEKSSPGLIVPAIGLAAYAFLGALAGGLGHALAASLFVAHRQSVQASEGKGPGS